ncbi:MAG: hypothetical protein ABR509_01190 [Candidatus Limnocylindria bacterium]
MLASGGAGAVASASASHATGVSTTPWIKMSTLLSIPVVGSSAAAVHVSPSSLSHIAGCSLALPAAEE